MSVAPTSRLNEPSSFILIVADAMSTTGMPEPCMWTDMPTPCTHVPVRRRVPRLAAQSMRSAPISMQRASSQLVMVWGTPSRPSPRAAKMGDVPPVRMWLRCRSSTGSRPIFSARVVHRHLERVLALGGAVAAVGAGDRHVGVDGAAVEVDVLGRVVEGQVLEPVLEITVRPWAP